MAEEVDEETDEDQEEDEEELEEEETDAAMVAYDPQIFPDIFVLVRCPGGLHVRVVLERNMTVAEIIQEARIFVAATAGNQAAFVPT